MEHLRELQHPQRKCWFKSGTQACLGLPKYSRSGSGRAAKLPKPGLSVITVQKSVYDQLRGLAESQGLSISKFLERAFNGTVPGLSQFGQNTPVTVLRPGFEPGSPDRESGILSASLETGLYYRSRRSEKISLS